MLVSLSDATSTVSITAICAVVSAFTAVLVRPAACVVVSATICTVVKPATAPVFKLANASVVKVTNCAVVSPRACVLVNKLLEPKTAKSAVSMAPSCTALKLLTLVLLKVLACVVLNAAI